MTNIIDSVGVYGTLKRWFNNERVMKNAWWEFNGTDYIRVKALQNIWYPMIKLSNNSNKWLEIEIYNVPLHWIKWALDWLEGYFWEWHPANLYNRVKVETKSGRDVWIYEINHKIKDELETYFTHIKGEELYYSWTI